MGPLYDLITSLNMGVASFDGCLWCPAHLWCGGGWPFVNCIHLYFKTPFFHSCKKTNIKSEIQLLNYLELLHQKCGLGPVLDDKLTWWVRLCNQPCVAVVPFVGAIESPHTPHSFPSHSHYLFIALFFYLWSLPKFTYYLLTPFQTIWRSLENVDFHMKRSRKS